MLSAVGAYEYDPTLTFCHKHFLRLKAMQEIQQLRRQISTISNLPLEKLSPPDDTKVCPTPPHTSKTNDIVEGPETNHHIRIHRPSSSPPRHLPEENHNIRINPKRPLQSTRSSRGSIHPPILSSIPSITT